MRVTRCTAADIADWAALRAALWPDADEVHADACAAWLAAPDAVALICRDADGAALGFAEAALRRDYVNGCDTSPVGFGEGVYVAPQARRRGVGRALVAALEGWTRAQGCTELASDALLDNRASHAFHAALGFAETERVVYFRRLLNGPG